ncbi:MAG: TonB-dependent receptor, partial [Bacteroidota bacterium]
LNIIDDWIQWTPIEGAFQPVNQRKVRNLGFELKVEESILKQNDQEIKLVMRYAFTDSRIAKQYVNDTNVGKRTIFVPAHKLNGQITWKKSTLLVFVRPTYYSKRFDTVDNSSFVSGFLIADIGVQKSFKLNKSEINLSLTAENAFNNDYENIRFFPMPLRLFALGFNVKL